jgi:dTDP-4-dehydrorhamnose reductase
MRILIVGGDGMLGHRLYLALSSNHDVRVTLRRDIETYSPLGIFTAENSYADIDVTEPEALGRVLADFHPEAIINAAGIVKQRPTANETLPSLLVNAVFPHRLALLAEPVGARVIQFSTDCVFSGRQGCYSEADAPDPEDIYGRTKLLGELTGDRCLTLRTSIVGPELWRKRGLIEWYLSQKGRIPGFTNALFSGLTTREVSRLLERLLIDFPGLSGLWHVASSPISKYDLLKQLTDALGRDDIEIEPDGSYRCNRVLDAARFNEETRYAPPTWTEMIHELASDIARQ